jgi:hypothetical protein
MSSVNIKFLYIKLKKLQVIGDARLKLSII